MHTLCPILNNSDDDAMQPGYLRDLLPHSAPDQPESLQNILDGDVSQLFASIY